MGYENCCSSGYAYGGRRFWTAEEKKAWLEEYAEGLENELKAVKERLGELGGKEV